MSFNYRFTIKKDGYKTRTYTPIKKFAFASQKDVGLCIIDFIFLFPLAPIIDILTGSCFTTDYDINHYIGLEKE
jgi:hypothetical protein